MDTNEVIWVFERMNSFGAFRGTLNAIRDDQFFTAAHLARMEKSWVINCAQPGGVCRELNAPSLPKSYLRDLDKAIAALDTQARAQR